MGKRVIVFATHKDDEALIAGGILTSGNSCLVVSSCASDETRDDVFYSNADKFGYEAKCLGFRDSSLSDFIPELADAITASIEDFRPDIIISNHFIDVHQDHRANAHALMIATRPSLLFNHAMVMYGYGCSLYEQSEKYVPPNAFIELNDDQIDAKATMMENYATETRRNRNTESIKAHSVYDGCRFGVKYAESYHATKVRLL